MTPSLDHIIAGYGPARGAPVAALSERTPGTFRVLEAGPADDDLRTRMRLEPVNLLCAPRRLAHLHPLAETFGRAFGGDTFLHPAQAPGHAPNRTRCFGVADTAISPEVISANTNAPSTIGWRAGDLIADSLMQGSAA